MIRTRVLAVFMAIVAAAASGMPVQARTKYATPVTLAPAGAYTLDKYHASITFRVDHIGFSMYVGRFDAFDAKLAFDPAKPTAMTVEADIQTGSLSLPAAPAGFRDTLLGSKWLNAMAHPKMAFRSTRVVKTGAKTANVTGDFTFRGVTKPVTLAVTFNGGYDGHPFDPNARIGFSASGHFMRSAFGMTEGIPAPGTKVGVSDRVDVSIEAEFTGPPKAP